MTRAAAGALLAAAGVSGPGCRGDFQAEQGTSGSTASDGSAEGGFSLDDEERAYTNRRSLDRYIEVGERLEKENRS